MPAFSFFFVVSPPPEAFGRTEQGNTFLTVAFGGQIWNIQYARPVVNGKVKAFHHTALNQSVHKEVVPASLLCQQIAFKLATAFSFSSRSVPFSLSCEV